MRRLTQIPELHSKKIAAAHANLTRLAGTAAELARAIAVAEAGHVAALTEDRDALAKATREGKPEPKPASKKAKGAIETAKRRHEAAEQAVTEAEQALADLIEAERPVLQRQAAERLDARRQAYRAAVDALAAANAELAVEEKTEQWLAQWPDGKFAGGRRFVADLPPQPNGDPVAVEDVLDALRKRGLPPEPHRARGALRFDSGAVAPPSPPMIESLTGPQGR
jgi:hypothetical protein